MGYMNPLRALGISIFAFFFFFGLIFGFAYRKDGNTFEEDIKYSALFSFIFSFATFLILV